jgi:glucokinase
MKYVHYAHGIFMPGRAVSQSIARIIIAAVPRMSSQLTSTKFIVAGDIGATNTRLALYKVGQDPFHHQRLGTPVRVANFKGEDYPGLVEILHIFLAEEERSVIAACFGAAGPVVEDRVKLTNIPWTVDASELKAAFGWKHVWLLNDLQAIANAVPLLSGDELHTLNAGNPVEHGTIMVIAPGTGLGIGYLTWAGGRYHPHATEGGHADFAPSNELQRELLAYLSERMPQVAVEHVCSGIGMPNVYAFLKETKRAAEPDWLTAALAAADDPNTVIFVEGLLAKPGSELCQMALHIFVDVLAAESGSLALSYGSTGGVYIAGGIPPRILPAFQRYNFLETFKAKTAYEYYLERFPVRIALNTEAGLMGAAAFGMLELTEAV